VIKVGVYDLTGRSQPVGKRSVTLTLQTRQGTML